MRTIATFILSVLFGLSAAAQTQPENPGFENWGNASPGVSAEPTNWYSNQSGSSVAQLGPQTCFKDSTTVYAGSYSVRLESTLYGGIEVVNGNVTTGVINAPTISKANGYIGTVNYSTPSDDRRMAFTGRPDSLVGWFQYTKGGVGEQGKIRAILHINDYYDPETPTTYHPDPTANKIADALYMTDTNSVSIWTRFSVPFNYVSANAPTYIMINATSSANQTTNIAGSKLWLDNLSAVYNPTSVNNIALTEQSAKVYSYYKTLYVDFLNRGAGVSSISVYDMAGRQVLKQAVKNSQLNAIDVSNLSTGVYVYDLHSNGFQKSGKVFVQ